jgi:hypothetical protein
MLKHIFLILVLAVSFYLWDQRPIKHGAGVLAPDAPTVQRGFQMTGHEIQHYTLQPRYRIEGTSRILSNQRYWFDEKSTLSPVDFVLGWGKMSDERIIDQIKTPIRGRDYKIDVIRPPLTFNQIRSELFYMHAIPADEEIEEKLKKLKTGNVIKYKGYLVDVHDRSGILWRTSLQNGQPKLDSAQLVYITDIETEL